MDRSVCECEEVDRRENREVGFARNLTSRLRFAALHLMPLVKNARSFISSYPVIQLSGHISLKRYLHYILLLIEHFQEIRGNNHRPTLAVLVFFIAEANGLIVN